MSTQYYYSPNYIFMIDTNSNHKLYSKEKLNFKFLKSSNVTIKNVPYFEYTFNKSKYKYINDCLQFAEGLLINEPGYCEETPVSRPIHKNPSSKNYLIGDSDEQNIEASKDKDFQFDDMARPKIGQAFAIIRQKVVIDKHPYHIAFVIAKDSDSIITIEADASDPSRTNPIFNIYSTNPSSGKTFHSSYISYYRPASTLILKGII